jgi:hypothetical protein
MSTGHDVRVPALAADSKTSLNARGRTQQMHHLRGPTDLLERQKVLIELLGVDLLDTN